MTDAPAPALLVQLLPDWSPSRRPGLARFDALVKVTAGTRLPPGAQLTIELLGALGGPQVLDSELDGAELLGPTWRHVRGRLVEVAPTVTTVLARLAGQVSDPVSREDAPSVVSLVVIPGLLGAADEPLLWWCYRNTGSDPVGVRRLRAGTALRADGHRLPLGGPYNGPAELPPGRALSGFWVLRDLAALGPGRHRVELVVEHHLSNPVLVSLG